MIKQTTLAIATILLLGYVGPSQQSSVPMCWTKWYNRDSSSGSGDFECLSALIKENPKGSICAQPLDIEAVTVDGEIPAYNTGQNFYSYSPTKGFICRNKDQSSGSCKDYKVRFGCECLTDDPEAPLVTEGKVLEEESASTPTVLPKGLFGARRIIALETEGTTNVAEESASTFPPKGLVGARRIIALEPEGTTNAAEESASTPTVPPKGLFGARRIRALEPEGTTNVALDATVSE